MIQDKLSELIVNYCSENNLSVIELGDPVTHVRVFMIAESGTIDSEGAAIVSAHMLLSGIVNGGYARAEVILKDDRSKSVN